MRHRMIIYRTLTFPLCSVLQIVYSEPHVFVSLHNGALVVYTRDKEGVWDMENYQLIVVDITGMRNYW